MRATIIETAATLFYANGYNSTGINEVIAKAGIAKATLYNHFSSKEELCLAYLRQKNEQFFNQLRPFCADYPEGKARILALFDFLSMLYAEDDFNGCWCIKTVAEIPKDNQLIRSEIQLQKQQLIRFIAGLINENLPEITTNKVDTLAKQVYLLYEGGVSESHLHQRDWPIKEMKNLCAQIIG